MKTRYLLLFLHVSLSLCISKGEITKVFIEQFLHDSPIIIDAGSYDGKDAIGMAKKWEGDKIYAFEPIPKLFNNLKRNTRSYSNIQCFSYALSNKTSSELMYVSGGKDNGSSSLLVPKEHLRAHPTITFEETINVKTITLDTWAKDNNIDHIDLLWFDLQGMELDVLKASPNILKTVQVIHTEVSLIETYEKVPLYQELKDWLCKRGFIVVKEELPWKDMGNVLFVRASDTKKLSIKVD